MTHLAQHAREDRPIVVLDGLADLAEAERAQRAAVALALADLAADLRDADLRHQESFFRRRTRRFGFFSSAGGASAAGSGSGVGSGSGSAASTSPCNNLLLGGS